MRVGYLTYGLDRNPTGIGRYAVQLGNALCSTVPDLELVVLSTERGSVQDHFPGCEVHKIPASSRLPGLLTAGDAALSLVARRLDLDIVHDPNGIAPFFTSSTGYRRIVTIHDAFAFVCPEEHNRLDILRYRQHLPRVIPRCDAVITVSQCSRRDLGRYLNLNPSSVRVIPEGVDERFRPVADTAERRATLERYGVHGRYIFYVGGINGRKNLETALAAVAGLPDAYQDVRFVIAGKRQWQTGRLDRLISGLEASDRVVFTGYVDDGDLPSLYSAAELFVFPSLYEGFGLPPLEAMACGTAVVASTAGALPEVLGDAALLAHPLDLAAWTAAMSRVLGDARLRDSLRSRGLMRAAMFDWRCAALETYSLYQRVVSGVAANEAAEGARL